VAKPDPQDLKGPLAVAAVATIEKARIVVYGTSNIAANQFLNIQGNRDFFLNTVSWLAEEEDQISIRPKDVKQTPVFMSENQAKAVFFLPVVVLRRSCSPAASPRSFAAARRTSPADALAVDRGPGRHSDRARRLLLRLRDPPGPEREKTEGRKGRVFTVEPADVTEMEIKRPDGSSSSSATPTAGGSSSLSRRGATAARSTKRSPRSSPRGWTARSSGPEGARRFRSRQAGGRDHGEAQGRKVARAGPRGEEPDRRVGVRA